MIGKFDPRQFGKDTDPRFTLANERTYLAWIRTGLAFLAGGVALDLAPSGTMPTAEKNALIIVMLVSSLLIGTLGIFRWRRVEIALRKSEQLPGPGLMPLLGVCLTGGVALALVHILRLVG